MGQFKRISFLAVVVSFALLGAGCAWNAPAGAPGMPAPAAGGGVNVSMANFSFQPSNVTVASGTTVSWTNNDSMPHTITADDGSFDSGNIAAGAVYSHTFSSPGSVPYHCTIHGSMHGTVTVTQ